mmetsp:Transcript_82530/g.252207  ORF Transcript_82530/g.252207 Transcript_82530/m.252207 type:complete len:204 (+) Transcript_82530:188-799(+)
MGAHALGTWLARRALGGGRTAAAGPSEYARVDDAQGGRCAALDEDSSHALVQLVPGGRLLRVPAAPHPAFPRARVEKQEGPLRTPDGGARCNRPPRPHDVREPAPPEHLPVLRPARLLPGGVGRRRSVVRARHARPGQPLRHVFRHVLDAPSLARGALVVEEHPLFPPLGEASFVAQHLPGPLDGQPRQCHRRPLLCPDLSAA